MRRCGLTGLALALLLGGALADGKKEGKKENKRLKGTWQAVRAVVDGKEEPFPEEGATVTLEDGKYTARVGDKVVDEGTFKVNPRTTPKSVDITPSTGPNKGKTHRAIYEVKGDNQRVCTAAPGRPRPRAFKSKEGSGHALVTYKRVKAKD